MTTHQPGEEQLGEVVRAKRPERLPVVLSVEETEKILEQLSGTHKLMVLLLYGAGMRLMEVIRLRVKDIDFDQNAIIVRDGKGQKDRAVPLPRNTVAALKAKIADTKLIHDQDLRDGYGTVYLPHALERKYPNTNKAFHWQYVFPSTVLSVDPRSGRKQRHHIFESVLQVAIKTATAKAGVRKDVHAHSFRHSFASHLLASGTDIRSIQQLLGHVDVSTTMIYTHIMKTGPLGVVSPSDRIRVDTTDLMTPSDAEESIATKTAAVELTPPTCTPEPPQDNHSQKALPERPHPNDTVVQLPRHAPRLAERLRHAFNAILALIFPRLLLWTRGGLS